jgi:hypothetical protein
MVAVSEPCDRCGAPRAGEPPRCARCAPAVVCVRCRRTVTGDDLVELVLTPDGPICSPACALR